MSMEDDLRLALRRKEAPPGFADRVVQIIDQQQRPRSPGRIRMYAAAALLAVTLGSGTLVHQHQERRRGEEAKHQLLLAIGIAAAKADIARQALADANEN